uniref:Dehydrogenase/reductase 2 n=1 Tax=Equus caballus TaxID=9796 RepID=A0A5F5PUI4_HORSE
MTWELARDPESQISPGLLNGNLEVSGHPLLRSFTPLALSLLSQALEHCGGVDFLVCVAGVNPLVGSTLGASEQVWNKLGVYNTSKTALLGLCKSLAVELAPKGIRVNCLVTVLGLGAGGWEWSC